MSKVILAPFKLVGKVFTGLVGAVLGGLKPKTKSSSTANRLSKSLVPEDFRKIVFGETAGGTDLRFWEVHGTKKDLYSEVLAAASHRIQGYKALYIEQDQVSFSGGSATGKYAGVLQRRTNLGTVGQAALAVGAGSYWGSSAKFTGVAHYALQWTVDEKKLPGGVPSRYTQVVEGALLYDPRRDSTRGGSGTHRADDQSTWQYSPLDSNGVPIGRNNALQVLWYMIGWRIADPTTGALSLVAGRGVSLDDIDFASFITAANDAEALEYYTDCILSTGDDHSSNEGVLTADGLLGELLDTGGRWTYRVTKDDTADVAVSLTADDVLPGDVSWKPFAEMSEQYNEVVGTFIDPAELYQERAYPMVSDPAYYAEDGFKRRTTQNFQAVQSAELAQRLARLLLNRNRYRGEFRATFSLNALRARAWDCVELTIPRYGFASKLFRVIDQTITASGIEMLLREDDDSVYSGGTVDPHVPPSALVQYDPRDGIALEDLGVVSASRASGDSVIDGLLVNWATPPGNVRRTEVQTRLVGEEYWTSSVTTQSDATSLFVGPLLPTADYQVRARHISIYEVPGPWAYAGETTDNLTRVTAGNIVFQDGSTLDVRDEQIKDELQELFADAAQAELDINAAELLISQLQGSVTADFTAVNQAVSLLQSDVSAAKTNITSLQSTAGALGTSVSTLQGQMTSAQGSISTINGQVSSLSTQVGTVTGNVSTLQGQVGTINTNIGTVTANVSALTTRITAAEGSISTLQSTVATQGASITTNTTAITNVQGSLAEYQLRLSSNTRNLLPNGGPEALLRGWTGSTYWTVNSNNSEGAYFLCSPPGSGVYVITSGVVPMEAGVQLTLGYETRNTGGTAYCDIECLDAAMAQLLDGPQNAGPAGTSWGDRAARAVAITTPAGTAFVRVRLVLNASSASDRGRIRQIKLEKGATWTAYSNEASVGLSFTALSTAEASVASLTTTVSTQGAAITTAQTAITTLEGTTSTLSTTVSSQGTSITNLQTAMTTANGSIASLTTRVGTAEGSITSQATAISTLQGSVSTLQSTVSSQGASITSLQTAMSTANGSIATLQTRVAANSPNLLPNGGLENGFASGVGSAGGYGFAISADWGPIATTAATGNQIFVFSQIAASPGRIYTLACDAVCTGAGSTVYCDMIFRDSGNNVLLDSAQNVLTGVFDFDTTTGRRGQIAATATAPAGTTNVLCRFVGNALNGGTVGFRQMKMERASTWSTFSSEASVISTWTAINTATGSLASLTTTVSTQGTSITTAQTAITNLTGRTATLETSVTSQGASITTLQSTTTTQGGSIATLQTQMSTANANISSNATAISTVSGDLATLSSTVSTQGASITTLQSAASTLTGNLATLTTRVNASQTNLLPNGGLENGFTGAISTSGFVLNNTPEWGPAGATAATGTNVFQFADITVVQPGATYWVSCDPIAFGASSVYCDLLFLNAAGAVLLDGPQNNQTGPFNFSPDDTRRGLIATSAVAPANTARIRTRVVAEVVGGATAGFRRVKVETGPRWTPFSQEASVVSTWSAVTTAASSLATLTTRVGTAEGSITTLQSSMTSATGSISTLQTNVSSLQGSVSTLQSSSTTQAGQISTLQSTVSTQGASITSQGTAITTLTGNLSTLTSVVGASSNPNLIPGFENQLAGWFQAGYTVTVGGWGLQAERTSDVPTGLTVLDSPSVPIFGGRTYTAAADSALFMTSGAATLRIEIIFKNSAGSIVGNPQSGSRTSPHDFDDTGASRAVLKASGVAPATAVAAYVRLTLSKTSGVLQVVAWRQVKLEQGAIATPYSGEATVVQTYSAYATLNSSFAALSSTVSSQGGSISTLQSSFTGLNGTVSALSSTVSAQGTSISSLQTASSTQAGLISTLQTQVVAGGGNLLQNTDFAVDLTAWGFNQSGTAHSGGRDLLGDNYRPLNEHTIGIYHSNSNAADFAFWTSDRVAVTPGKFYEFSAGVANARAHCNIYLRFLYGDGSIAQDFIAAKTTFSEGRLLENFPTSFARGQAPAGTWWVQCILQKSGTLSGNSDSYAWFVRPQLVEVPGAAGGPVAYSPGGTSAVISLQAQAISTTGSQLSSLSSTVSTQGGSISTLQSSLTTLTGSVSTLQSTVSTQGASITSLQTATSTLQGSVATLTTRVSASSPNLLPNGGLENGFATGIAFTSGYGYGVSADWGAIATTTASGIQVLQFSAVPANAGRTYTLACDPVCVGTGNTVYCDMLFRDASNNILLDSPQNPPPGTFDFDPTNGRRGQIAITATAPAGTTNVVCRFVGAVNSAGAVGFRQMKLERGSTWSPFSAEASITQSFSTLSALGTQYASLSSTVSTQGVTISNQATAITSLNGLFAKVGVTLDVNGYITGWAQMNNGSTGSMVINADYFSIVKPGGGARTEYSGGNWRVYNASGNLKVRMGVW